MEDKGHGIWQLDIPIELLEVRQELAHIFNIKGR